MRQVSLYELKHQKLMPYEPNKLSQKKWDLHIQQGLCQN